MSNAQHACVKLAHRMARCVNHYKGLLSRLKFNINNRFVHLVMHKQSGNSVKGKEAEMANERRPGSQPRKSVLKGKTKQ